MIVLFKILALLCFKAIRSSSLILNEIMIAFIAKGTQGITVSFGNTENINYQPLLHKTPQARFFADGFGLINIFGIAQPPPQGTPSEVVIIGLIKWEERVKDE